MENLRTCRFSLYNYLVALEKRINIYQKSLIFTILVADCPQGATGKFTSDRKSIKSVGTGGSGGRRSSSSLAPANANSGPVSSNSLGSNFASAASGSSSGGKRSLHSGGYYYYYYYYYYIGILFFSFWYRYSLTRIDKIFLLFRFDGFICKTGFKS